MSMFDDEYNNGALWDPEEELRRLQRTAQTQPPITLQPGADSAMYQTSANPWDTTLGMRPPSTPPTGQSAPGAQTTVTFPGADGGTTLNTGQPYWPGAANGAPKPDAWTAPAPAPTNWQLQGFDSTKLNDPTHVGPGKYSPAVKHFASQIQGLAPTSQNLGQVVAHAKANGFPNAKAVSGDRIDYGDGMGPIDAIIDVGGAGASWWFQNGPDRLGGGAGGTGGGGGTGGTGGGGGGTGGGGTGIPGVDIPPPPGQFDDPATKYLEDFMKNRLAELNAPLNDPARARLGGLLDQQVDRYGGMLTEQQALNETLRGKQAGANASADEYINYLRQQSGDLRNLPPEIQAAYDQLVVGTNKRITDLSQLPPELAQQLAQYRKGTSTRISDLQNLPPEYQQALDQYVSQASSRATDLQSLPPELQAAMREYESGTKGRMGDLQNLPPELQAALTDLMTQTSGRMDSLRAPAYTGTEQEIMRTQALDPIEADRQAAKQRDIARIAQTGMLPSSGISLALQGDTDRAYDKQRNTAQGDLAYKQIEERRSRDAEIQRLAEGLFGTRAGVSAVGESRKGEAQSLLESLTSTKQGVVQFGEDRKTQASALRDQIFGAQEGAVQFGEGRRTEAQDLLSALTQTEADAASYQDSRGADAQTLRGDLVNAATDKSTLDTSRKLKAGELLGAIPDIQRGGAASDLALNNELNAALERISQGQIGTAGQRAGLNEQVRGEEQSRRDQALTLASLLQQLPTAAMQQAMAAIGQAPNPESMINQLITMFGIGQTTRNQNAQYYGSLAQSIPYLASAFKGGGGGGASGLPGGSGGAF